MKDTATLKWPRPGAAAPLAPISLAVLGSFLLLGCSNLPPVTPAPPAGMSRPVYSVNMPLDDLTKDPDARAILYRDVPGVMNNPKYPLFEDMSLAQVAIMAAGKLPQEKLDQVQADFDRLAAQK